MNLIIPFLIAFTVTSGYAQKKPPDTSEKQKQMSYHYQLALQYFSAGEYEKAIQHWEEILKIDPGQVQPPKLIAIARERIREEHSGILSRIEAAYMKGNYSFAIDKTTELASQDPTNSEFKRLGDKLKTIYELFGDLTGNDPISRLLRISVYNFIKDTKPKTMVNSAIYASQLSPKNEKIKKFIELLKSTHADVFTKIELLEGVNLVEQKLFSALKYIYDKKFDEAILECNEVLELEPENIMALKRLGSAYYALKKFDKAKEIWRKAQKLAPEDEELKKFLGK